MNISNVTLELLNKALNQLKFANITNNQWILGGGTILRYFYNHRESNDVDIFFNNPQLITFVSPRINDSNEDNLCYYSEQQNFVKLNFEIGDVDFIFSKQITSLRPKIINILDNKIFIDHPIEIIAKKIFYRFDSITIRDLIDIAIVYTKEKDNLVKTIDLIDKIKILNDKILNKSIDFSNQLNKIKYLRDGLFIYGKEIEICQKFFKDIIKTYNIKKNRHNASTSFHL